jgi:hypothetical protein
MRKALLAIEHVIAVLFGLLGSTVRVFVIAGTSLKPSFE